MMIGLRRSVELRPRLLMASGTHSLPKPRFDHLKRMTDHRGLWEHARYTTPRIEHGYCTDDNARALIVVVRQPDPSADLIDLAGIYLTFLRDAQLPDGSFVNRRGPAGSWTKGAGSDDSQGRALWAAGTAARQAPEAWMRDVALGVFAKCRRFNSPSPRANAFAVLGASEVLAVSPHNRHARRILQGGLAHLRVRDDAGWPWPEDRLAYDNARIPEALIAAGAVLSSQHILESGLRLLAWLVAAETHDDHFSFTPVAGWAPGEPRPAFDQQPLEAAAMTDACARAWTATGDVRWKQRVVTAALWFMGANDGEAILYDATTGGCGDGLMTDGINQNRGAESTLAALAALQHAAAVS